MLMMLAVHLEKKKNAGIEPFDNFFRPHPKFQTQPSRFGFGSFGL